MLRNPSLYGIPVEARDDDPKLEQWRANLVHTAAVQLEKSHLIKYDRKAGNFQVRFLILNIRSLLCAQRYVTTLQKSNLFNLVRQQSWVGSLLIIM